MSINLGDLINGKATFHPSNLATNIFGVLHGFRFFCKDYISRHQYTFVFLGDAAIGLLSERSSVQNYIFRGHGFFRGSTFRCHEIGYP